MEQKYNLVEIFNTPISSLWTTEGEGRGVDEGEVVPSRPSEFFIFVVD